MYVMRPVVYIPVKKGKKQIVYTQPFKLTGETPSRSAQFFLGFAAGIGVGLLFGIAIRPRRR